MSDLDTLRQVRAAHANYTDEQIMVELWHRVRRAEAALDVTPDAFRCEACGQHIEEGEPYDLWQDDIRTHRGDCPTAAQTEPDPNETCPHVPGPAEKPCPCLHCRGYGQHPCPWCPQSLADVEAAQPDPVAALTDDLSDSEVCAFYGLNPPPGIGAMDLALRADTLARNVAEHPDRIPDLIAATGALLAGLTPPAFAARGHGVRSDSRHRESTGSTRLCRAIAAGA